MEENKNKRKTVKTKKEKVDKEKSELKPIIKSETLNFLKRSSLARLFVFIASAVLLLWCMNTAYDQTKEAIGDGAYKYDEEAYTYINESIQNYLGEDGPDIVLLQENIPKWTSSYENGETTLVCTLEDGFFCAEVTAKITNDFRLIETTRNFNSLQEYQDYFWKQVKLSTAFTGLYFFSIASAILFAVCEVTLYLLGFIIRKKEEKAKADVPPAEEEAVPKTTDNSHVLPIMQVEPSHVSQA